MASSTAAIDLIAVGQAGKEKTANDLFFALSPALLFARRPAACVGLTWAYYGGRFGNVDVANGSLTLTASATNYIEANTTTGAVTSNAAGFTDGRLPLYTATVDAGGATTAYSDRRQAIGAAGTGGGSSAPGSFALTASTTNATPVAMLDGAGGEITLPLAGGLYGLRGTIVAADTGTAAAAMWEVSALARFIAGAASIIGAPTVTQTFGDAAAASWAVSFSATTGTRAVHVNVTGQASKTIAWVANLSATMLTPLSAGSTYTYSFATTADLTSYGWSLSAAAGVLSATSTASEASAKLDDVPSFTDGSIEVDVYPPSGAGGFEATGVMLRTDPSGFGVANGYSILVFFVAGTLRILTGNNGTSGPGQVYLTTVAYAFPGGGGPARLRVELAGTTITASVAGAVLATVTCPATANGAGRVGLWSYGAAGSTRQFANAVVSVVS